jgi:hypothetical protein
MREIIVRLTQVPRESGKSYFKIEVGNEEKLGSTPMEDRAAEKIANMIIGLLQTHGPTPIGMATGNREDLEEKGEQIIQQHEQQQRN